MPGVDYTETANEPDYLEAFIPVLPVGAVDPAALKLLVWAAIAPDGVKPSGAFCGVGCTSSHGFPIDFLAMPLAAHAAGLVQPESPFTYLVADHHAALTGCGPEEAGRRGRARKSELFTIGRALRQPTEIVLASDIVQDAQYCLIDNQVRQQMRGIVDEQATPYNVQAISDAVYMAINGRMKIGWTRHSHKRMKEGKGRSDEFNGTDRFAKRILPAFGAMYIRHGVTADSQRPAAVPYSVHTEGVSVRLMLTGEDRGHFREKIALASPRRAVDLIKQLDRIVACWERSIGNAGTGDVVSKAENIVEVVNNT